MNGRSISHDVGCIGNRTDEKGCIGKCLLDGFKNCCGLIVHAGESEGLGLALQ